MERRFSSSVFLTHTPKGQRQPLLLLCFHKRFGTYLPVGGELEPEETPLGCAIREVKEETGLELIARDFPLRRMPGTPRGFMGFEEHHAGIKDGIEVFHMNFVFEAETLVKEVTCCPEHTTLLWFSLRELACLKPTLLPNVWFCISKIYRLRNA